MRPRTIYTERTVGLVQKMLDDGASNTDIALAIGTTENRLIARLSQLGIKRTEPHPYHNGKTTSVRIPMWLIKKYAVAASARNLKANHLICAVLAVVAEDNLFEAILDDGK